MKGHASYERRAVKMAKQADPTFAQRRRFEKQAEKRFIRLLDKALDACYEARMESVGCVLTMPIKDLFHYLTTETTFGKKA